jgi:hypothetical protein
MNWLKSGEKLRVYLGKMLGGGNMGKRKWEKLRSGRKMKPRKTRRVGAPKGQSTCSEKGSFHESSGLEDLITRFL